MTKTYKEIRSNLSTGDLVLFSGESFLSQVIQRFSGSKHSHIGMAIVSEEWDSVMLWESTTLSNIKNASGQRTKGVQLVSLSTRLQTYDGQVAVRHISPKATPSDCRVLRSLRRELQGRPYEESKIDLALAAMPWLPFSYGEEDLSSCFCSEIVAEGYQRVKWIGDERPSDRYDPGDFGEGGIVKLLDGRKLSDEIPIVW